VLIVDFVSLVFQMSTENEHDTQTNNRETKIRLSQILSISPTSISYRLKKTDIDPSLPCVPEQRRTSNIGVILFLIKRDVHQHSATHSWRKTSTT